MTDARQYKAEFARYCRELSESDPSISQYDPDELAEENLHSSLDHA